MSALLQSSDHNSATYSSAFLVPMRQRKYSAPYLFRGVIMRNFFGFPFSSNNQKLSEIKEQKVDPDITAIPATDMSCAKKPKSLIPAKHHVHLKKMEEHRRNLRTMYFSS
ncbi:hypothetical protein H8L32_13335 [Undibacterium sp. CY18W]|uniref:Uncharacterized protein n=1 Tax=Undibacterium hunanense TaxID=2762292 RepID=A0ABR6ZRG9_9BURK|nr:hypothetical protein [Undibacterium hunanense]MBC3918469.1 hypothetical protein [Undibacterium hunanense]